MGDEMQILNAVDVNTVVLSLPKVLMTQLEATALTHSRGLSLEIQFILAQHVYTNATINHYNPDNGDVTGKIIANWRSDNRVTQDKLATLLGTYPETISRWENGHNEVSPAYRLKFSSIKDVYKG